MIVVDTNVIVYFLLIENKTPQARKVYQRDPHWAVPTLWRSEFHNVLSLYLRKDKLTFDQALQLAQEAEEILRGKEHRVDSNHVLQFVAQSKCSAYDCEYVALAQQFNVKLVTADKLILSEFPRDAISLENFIEE